MGFLQSHVSALSTGLLLLSWSCCLFTLTSEETTQTQPGSKIRVYCLYYKHTRPGMHYQNPQPSRSKPRSQSLPPNASSGPSIHLSYAYVILFFFSWSLNIVLFSATETPFSNEKPPWKVLPSFPPTLPSKISICLWGEHDHPKPFLALFIITNPRRIILRDPNRCVSRNPHIVRPCSHRAYWPDRQVAEGKTGT